MRRLVSPIWNSFSLVNFSGHVHVHYSWSSAYRRWECMIPSTGQSYWSLPLLFAPLLYMLPINTEHGNSKTYIYSYFSWEAFSYQSDYSYRVPPSASCRSNAAHCRIMPPFSCQKTVISLLRLSWESLGASTQSPPVLAAIHRAH